VIGRGLDDARADDTFTDGRGEDTIAVVVMYCFFS
jgi:hypothetical protein